MAAQKREWVKQQSTMKKMLAKEAKIAEKAKRAAGKTTSNAAKALEKGETLPLSNP